MGDDYDDIDDLGRLRDRLRQQDRELAALRAQRDEQDELIRRMSEHAEDYVATLEAWRETFDMVLTDDGWTWKPFWDERWQTIDDYNELVKRWNRALVRINAGLQPAGRPLAASDAQVATVAKLRKAGRSLRGIAEDTNLSFTTVRTIVSKINGTDRATKKRRQGYERIATDKTVWAHRKNQKRTGDALPKRMQKVIETGNELVTEAKGLGRARS
jgi:hypothetical protein